MTTAYQETGRFRPDVTDFVKRELHRGVSGDSYGYHGTSVHTLLTMLRAGVIPGKTSPDEPQLHGAPQRGDLYFWKSEPRDYRSVEAIRRAVNYAEDVAQKHSFMRELDLSFDSREYMSAALELTDVYSPKIAWERTFEFIKQQGLSEIQINEAIANSQKMKGVLIGLSQQLTNKFTIVDCAPDDGWKIETQTGLPFQFIQGIRFLGAQDEQLFRRHLMR